MRLTKSTIDNAVYEGNGTERDVRWDTEVSGFGVRIYPSGKKSFILNYRTKGRQRCMTLGPYGVLTLDQARKDAKVKLSQVIQGADPLEKRQREHSAETVGALCDLYIERHVPRKKSGKEDIRLIKNFIRPAWHTHKVKSIQHSDVAYLHRTLGKSSIYTANRLVTLIGKMWECARQWSVIERTADNPARGIEKYKEEARTRWVTPEEMPLLADAINSESGPYVRAAIWLYIMTGLRKSEWLQAKWEHIDFERGLLNLPDSKNGEPIHHPLSSKAIEILKSLPRQHRNPYVLCGREPGQHLVNIYKPWTRIRKQAGLEDVRIQDLRRTLGSWLVQSGTSLNIVSKILNHKDIRVTDRHYGHFAKNHLRAPMDEHADRVLKVINERQMPQLTTGVIDG